MGGQVCTAASALQLAGLGLSFLLAVLLLDVLWVRLPRELHDGKIAPMLKRQGLLNLFVGIGAVGAAVLLLVWVNACGL